MIHCISIIKTTFLSDICDDCDCFRYIYFSYNYLSLDSVKIKANLFVLIKNLVFE